MLFLGTEFGVYFSNNGGIDWNKLSGGIPNISVRDLAIQKRENDLVAGTFGRGIYILDDYYSLRFNDLKSESQIFKIRDDYWYIEKRPLGGGKKASQGDGFFVAENPPFGAQITYFLEEKYLSSKEIRIKQENQNEKDDVSVSVPAWETLDAENNEISPKVWIFIYNDEEKIITKIKAKNKAGINRINWNLTADPNTTIRQENMNKNSRGILVSPGNYYAEIFKQVDGKFISISNREKIKVKPLNNNNQDYKIIVDYWNKINILRNQANDLFYEITELEKKTNLLLKSYERAEYVDSILHIELLDARMNILKLKQKMNGSKSRDEVGEEDEYPTIWTYLWSANGSSRSTYGPTMSHREYFNHASDIFNQLNNQYLELNTDIDKIIKKFNLINSPKIRY